MHAPIFLWPGVAMSEETAVVWFAPRDVGAMATRVPGDGHWAIASVESAPDATLMWKTILHPDAANPAAELFVVAIDISRVRLSAVAGTNEPTAAAAAPAAATSAANGAVRPGMIAAALQPALVAAFNGGWKSEHGHYGMMVDGVTLAPPKDSACTIAAYDDDTIRIAPWQELAATEPHMRFFRQAPACLYVHGARHAGLAAPLTTNWGAGPDGNPVIRRSAIGLDARGDVLYVGVSDAMTAPALADGMHHAGANDVAELDVNWAFPKLLVFHRGAAGLEAQSLFRGFVVDKDDYIKKRSTRDFFFVIRR